MSNLLFHHVLYLVCLILTLTPGIGSVNLLCRSNFQSYTLNYYYGGIYYTYVATDPCWHWYGSGNMEVQRPPEGNYTKMAELRGSSDADMTLCQTVSKMDTNAIYNFTFQFGLHLNIQVSAIEISLNDVPVFRSTKNRSTYPFLTTLRYVFVAKSHVYTFCVNSTQVYDTVGYAGTLVDNFVLEKIETTRLVIPLVVSYMRDIRQLTVQYVQQPAAEIKSHLLRNAKAYIDNRSVQLQKNSSNTNNPMLLMYGSNIQIEQIGTFMANTTVFFYAAYNVTLIEFAPSIHIVVDVQFSVDCLKNGTLVFQSTTYVAQEELDFIARAIRVSVNDASTTDMLFFMNEQSSLCALLITTGDIFIKGITFDQVISTFTDSQGKTAEYSINVEPVQQQYLLTILSESEKDIMMRCTVSMTTLMNVGKYTSSLSQALFTSFYLSQMLNMQVYLGLYTFVNLPNLTPFAYDLLIQQVTPIFNSSNSLLEMIVNATGLNTPIDNMVANGVLTRDKLGRYFWFGQLQVYYQFGANNATCLLEWLLLVLKFGLLKLLNSVFKAIFKTDMFRIEMFGRFICVEIMTSCYSMLVSTVQNLYQPHFTLFMHKLDLSLHIVMLLCLLMTPLVYLLVCCRQSPQHMLTTAQYLLYIPACCLVAMRHKQYFFYFVIVHMLATIGLFYAYGVIRIVFKLRTVLNFMTIGVCHVCFFTLYWMDREQVYGYNSVTKVIGFVIVGVIQFAVVTEMVFTAYDIYEEMLKPLWAKVVALYNVITCKSTKPAQQPSVQVKPPTQEPQNVMVPVELAQPGIKLYY